MNKIIYFLFIACQLCYSQNTYEYVWAKSGGGIDFLQNGTSGGPQFFNAETVREIVVDSQDNFYFLCNMTTGNRQFDGNPILSIADQGQKDVVLISTDCDGNFRWSKTFGSYLGGNSEYLAIDNNDNLYVGSRLQVKASSNSVDTQIDTDLVITSTLTRNDIGPHARTLFLVSYDSNGIVRWIHQPQDIQSDGNKNLTDIYGGIEIDSSGIIHTLVRLNEGIHENGNITVPVQPNPIVGQWFIIKYDNLGNYQSHQSIDLDGLISWDRTLFEYDEINDQYYIAISEYTSNNINVSYNNVTANRQAILLAIDGMGNELWRATPLSTEPFYIGNISLTSSNNLQIMARGGRPTAREEFLGFVYPPNTNSGEHLTVLTVDPIGTLLWGEKSNDRDQSLRVGLDEHNNSTAVAGAHSRNTVFSGLTYTTSFNALSDPVHFTLDTATGAGLSINSIKGNFGFHDGTVAVAFDSHGNMVLGGFMRESLFLNHPSVPIISRTGGYTDLWIAKLAKTDCNGVPLSLDQQESQTSLQLVQNPVKDLLSFKELPQQNNLGFKIYSLSGRVVLENTLNTNHPKIDVSQLNAGSYFIQVYMDNNHQTLKFVKE